MIRGASQQPVSSVTWVDPESLHANDYNPNGVAPPEMKLLKVSIIEDGWTQPIVITEDNEIVDGFHRWTLARTDVDVQAMTENLVPVVVLLGVDASGQRLSTVRHHRARGAHYVMGMANLVAELLEEGLSDAEIKRRCGMDQEELDRLRDRGSMIKRRAGEELGQAWRPGKGASKREKEARPV